MKEPWDVIKYYFILWWLGIVTLSRVWTCSLSPCLSWPPWPPRSLHCWHHCRRCCCCCHWWSLSPLCLKTSLCHEPFSIPRQISDCHFYFECYLSLLQRFCLERLVSYTYWDWCFCEFFCKMIFCKLKRPGRMQSPNFLPLIRPEV